MRQSAHKSKTKRSPLFRVVHRHAVEEGSLNKILSTAWTFAHSALWNGTHFSTAEIESAKDSIARYINSQRDRKKAFLSFCERILLAKILLPCQGENLALPSEWLMKSNRAGFGSTRIPYLQIRRLRKSIPRYQRDIRAMAEAVLEYGEDPTSRNYKFWAGYFSDRQATALLEVFQIYVCHCVFTN